MSEQKTNFMAELDAWTNEVVIKPVWSAALYNSEDFDQEVPEGALRKVRLAIREKVLESYKNGCRSGAGSVRREMSHAQAKAR